MVRPDPIPFAVPDIGQAEIDAVVDVMQSRWLTTGEQCRRFEEEFAAAVDATCAVALNSCTAAMHLSLEALGVGPDDLVFMSPYTFAATAEVVRYLGAMPVFIDIDPRTLNIDVEALRSAVVRAAEVGSGRPRVVMPVHIAGLPCDMTSIWALAKQLGLAVVEDAAHAFPSFHAGRPIGYAPADVPGSVCFSFYATKTITTGEGGMLVTNSEDLADRARSMSLHGLSRQAWDRYSAGGSWRYDIVAPGFKYNLTDIAAAMGRIQLGRALQMRERRASIAARYTAAFDNFDSLETPVSGEGQDHAWHLYLLRVRPEAIERGLDRDALIEGMREAGIGTSVHFIPLHLHSYYVNQYGLSPEDFPAATEEFGRVVSIPIYSAMTDSQVERVIGVVSDICG